MNGMTKTSNRGGGMIPTIIDQYRRSRTTKRRYTAPKPYDAARTPILRLNPCSDTRYPAVALLTTPSDSRSIANGFSLQIDVPVSS